MNLPSESYDLRGKFPTATVDSAYLTNPNNYYWAFTMDGLSRSVGNEWAWRGDAEYRIDNGFFKTLRAGVRLTDRHALTQISEPGNGYNWAAVSQTWMLGWDIPTLAYLNNFNAPYKTYSFPNYMNGAIHVPSAVIFPATSLATGWPNSFAKLQGFFTTLCQQLNPSCTNSWQAAALSNDPSQGGLNTQSERTYATFAELTFGKDNGPVPFDGNIGVRIVGTDDRAQGYMTLPAFPPSGGTPPTGSYQTFSGIATPVNAKNDYTDILPSLNVRFKFSHDLQGRIALSQGISRPDFSQLQAFTSLSTSYDNTAGTQSFTGNASGNPYLRPTKSNNLDLTLEWYFAPTGSLTAALFHKDLTDVVVTELQSISEPNTAGQSQPFTTTSPVNGAKGTVNGMEVAYQQYYDKLPGLLSGFGLQANFTLIDSIRKLYNPVTSAYCDSTNAQTANLNLNLNGCDTNGQTFGNLPLQNLSKYAYNLALLYDKGPLSARLAYSWRSRYLLAVNVNGANGTNGTNTDPNSASYGQQNISWGLPVYGDDYGQLDGGIFYKINDRVTLGLEGQNLTDSTYKELVQQHTGFHGFMWYKSGRSYTAQLRLSF